MRGAFYSPDYLDPTISKEELEKPLRDSDPRKYMKIKAAQTDDSTFADYDPLLKFVHANIVIVWFYRQISEMLCPSQPHYDPIYRI